MKRSALSILFSVLTFSIFFLSVSEPIWNPDSYSYVKFAEWLTDTSVDTLDAFYLTIRTPGYPLVLALGMSFLDYPDYIFAAHSIFGMLAAYFFLTLINTPKSFIKKSLVLLISYALFRFFYITIMTEWLAFTLILIILALVFKALTKDHWYLYFIIGLVSGFLVLVRPALVLFPFVIILAILFKNFNKTCFISMVLGLSLILSPWLAFNYQRYQKITLAEFGGYNLAGVAMTLAAAEKKDEDSAELTKYIDALNTKRLELSDILAASIPKIRHRVTYNIWEGAFSQAYNTKISIYQGNVFAWKYALRVIKNNFKKYFNFWLKQFQAYLFNLPLILFSVYLLIRLSKKESLSALGGVLLIAIMFDLSNFFVCSLFVPVLPRFLLLTGVPLMIIASLSVFALAEEN